MTTTTPARTALAPPDDVPGVTRRHRPSDLYHERTNFQFIKHSRRWAILSGTLILLSFVALFARGLNFGIDFEGGTSWQVQLAHGHSAHVADVRKLLGPLVPNATVSILSGQSHQSINVEDRLVTDPIQTVETTLATYGAVTQADVQFQQGATSGGTFTFTTAASVKPTKAAVLAALTKTELRNATVTVSGQNVTGSGEDAAGQPDRTSRQRARRLLGNQLEPGEHLDRRAHLGPRGEP